MTGEGLEILTNAWHLWRMFHLYGDVTLAGEGLQILTLARGSWPFSSVGSSACNTHCHTGHPFIMAISKDP